MQEVGQIPVQRRLVMAAARRPGAGRAKPRAGAARAPPPSPPRPASPAHRRLEMVWRLLPAPLACVDVAQLTLQPPGRLRCAPRQRRLITLERGGVVGENR